MRQREWLDRQLAAHPWRTTLALAGGLIAVYATMRIVDWQATLDARRPRRRVQAGGG